VTVTAFTLPPILADHWYVLAIGLVFFILQIYLCFRFGRRMRRHERELKRLVADLEDGGDGRDVDAFVEDIPWLKWVDANFPRDASTPGNFTRDDVLQELDTHIGSDGNYLLLQRTGIMAPLLGVIITVLGFAVLEVSDAEEQSLTEILMLVTPLVAGVGTGALLAFINQWLLQVVSGRVEEVRNLARGWFDAAIWSGVGLDTQAATVKAISAMERMARAVTNTAERQDETARVLLDSTRSIKEASRAFQETYASFGDRVTQLPDKLAELTDAAEAAVETLQAMIPVGERAVAGLDVSVSAFRTAVESNFVEAARSHQTATESLVESVGRINESTIQLKVSSGDLQETVNSHTNSFKNLNRSLNNQVLPAHEAFLAAISQFNGRGEGLLEQLDGLHGQIVDSLTRMTSLAPAAAKAIASFNDSATSFSDAVRKRFAPAAEEHQENTRRLSASVGELRKSTESLSDGESVVHNLAGMQVRLADEMVAVQQSLRQAVEQLAQASAAFHQSVTAEMAPSQQAMHEAAASFSKSAGQLNQFVAQGIHPATKRLHRLDETLAGLAGTVEAIRDFSHVRGDIERLSASLGKASAVSEAIGQLPTQIREVLEDVARAHQRELETRSSGGMMRWLRRKS
jgi:uncharacterized phage infection (PIP) family protein YhgE